MILTGTSYTALSSTVDMLAAELGDSSIAKKEKKGKKSQQKKGQKPHVVDANMEVTTPEQQLPDTEPTIAAVSPEELRVEASTGTGAVVAKDLSAVPVDKELKKRKAKPKSKKVATGEPELTTDIALAAQVGSEKNAQPSVLEPEGAEKNPKYDAPKMRAAPKEKKAVLVEPVVPVVTESAAAQAPKANKRRTEKKNTITAQDAHTLPAPIQAPPAAKVSQAQAPKKDKNESNTSNSSVKAAATENKNKVENKRSPKAKIAVVTESEITVEGDGFTTVVVGKARKQAVDGAPANVGKGQVKGHVR